MLILYQAIVVVHPIQLSLHVLLFFCNSTARRGLIVTREGVHTRKYVAEYLYSRKQYILPHSQQELNNAESIQRMCT